MTSRTTTIRKLANGDMLAVFHVGQRWYWTVVSRDGRRAVYGRGYPTRAAAMLQATLYSAEVALRGPADATAAADAADGA